MICALGFGYGYIFGGSSWYNIAPTLRTHGGVSCKQTPSLGMYPEANGLTFSPTRNISKLVIYSLYQCIKILWFPGVNSLIAFPVKPFIISEQSVDNECMSYNMLLRPPTCGKS